MAGPSPLADGGRRPAARSILLAAACALAACAASACRKPAQALAAPERRVNAALALDYPGRGDSGKNDLAWKGFLSAARASGATLSDGTATFGFGERGRMLCLAPKALGRDRAQLVRSMAEGGYSLLALLGESYVEAVRGIAPDFPGTLFVLIDARARQDMAENCRFVEFDAFQAAYLSGVLAASLLPPDGKASPGFVGDSGDPEAALLLDAWRAGASSVEGAFASAARNPARYLSPDAVEGKKLRKGLGGLEALSQIGKAGATIAFWAAGAPGREVLEKARASGVSLIRYPGGEADADASPAVLASAVKRYDLAVGIVLERYSAAETAVRAPLTLGLAEGCIELSVSEAGKSLADPKRAVLERASAALAGGSVARGGASAAE